MESHKQTDKPTSTRQRNKRLTIGYFTTSIGDDNVQTSWFGAEDAARQRDCNLICFSGGVVRDSHGFQAQGNVLYDLASAETVHGLVSRTSMIGANLSRDELVSFHWRYRPLPIISVGMALEQVPYVFVDG